MLPAKGLPGQLMAEPLPSLLGYAPHPIGQGREIGHLGQHFLGQGLQPPPGEAVQPVEVLQGQPARRRSGEGGHAPHPKVRGREGLGSLH